MAVSTSACGSGSAYQEGSCAMAGSTTGGRPEVSRPMPKMKRFTAYDTSDSPMMNWKVRGRSSSQTPEPANTPIATA
ncbi:hypothetical protein G6F31_016386 [Rhizopus arrhizus]|nr:hypothetical protein G6F31_016386 [Rhizopus arrhizus]